MFFCLSKEPDPRFSYHYNLGQLTLSTDAGWAQHTSHGKISIYKGYVDGANLDDSVQWIQDNRHTGNFCIFEYDICSGFINVKTNLYRGFLVWHDAERLCNLSKGTYTIWTDSTIRLDQELQLFEQKIDVIGPIQIQEISRQHLVESVHRRLQDTTRDFLNRNRRPLRVFCSGGIDSMLVFSYIKSMTDNFSLVWSDHVDWDEFWCRNKKQITSNFWGYKQIHHWRDPCVLTSGTPGDEFMLRSPSTSNLWLRLHGTSIPDELEQITARKYLHYDYFNLPKHHKIFDQQKTDELSSISDKTQYYWNLCNICVNDCQHWHLGNTLTWTPLRDLEIFKMFLRLSLHDGLGQIMDSSISKELISKNDPDLLNYLSDVKNTGENLSNLVGLMSRYPATSGQ